MARRARVVVEGRLYHLYRYQVRRFRRSLSGAVFGRGEFEDPAIEIVGCFGEVLIRASAFGTYPHPPAYDVRVFPEKGCKRCPGSARSWL